MGGKKNRGVIRKEEFAKNVLEKRFSERVMSLELMVEGVMLNIGNGHASQDVSERMKTIFWRKMDEMIEGVPKDEENGDWGRL